MPANPSLSLEQLARLVGVELPPAAASGSPQVTLTGCASLEDAGPSDLSFFAHPRYAAALRSTQAGAVLIPVDHQGSADAPHTVLLPVSNPSAAFSLALQHLRPATEPYPKGVHPSAVVDATVEFDPGQVSIGPLSVVGPRTKIGAGTVIRSSVVVGADARIGENCLLHHHVTVGERCILGNRVILQSGCVIGADGFGYEFADGKHHKIEQVGIVQIDDDVEVGANSTIDRARFGRTWIQTGVKIDNLVMIAHNVVLGEHCVIVAQTGIAGSSRLGSYCVTAAQTGIAGHLRIAAGTTLAARAAAINDIDKPGQYLGFPARPQIQTMRSMSLVDKLPELWKRLRALEKQANP
ncbi:MAG TPA: UDP-3-O-(3-hydroxymyristoyl)glucosamine N-acyltransferase [Verrucomicrobiales bacterium]|nr:UDP-3-O-(3-hydroxymyristoyl)glucosamine N-acyltransferase [Verrucomicrobiales bacterium]